MLRWRAPNRPLSLISDFRGKTLRAPFGCHAWNIYDRAFWEPHLIVDAATGGANDDVRHGNLSSGSRSVARHASSDVEL